ncbi:MAG: LapA family protein [Rubrivivax sp.]|jgi:putative membrane protein
MRIVALLLRAFIFFTLFAFALNNQQGVVVHWFFGAQWQAPMVIVVLVAFAAGCAVGTIAMVPAWWRRRRSAAPADPTTAKTAATAAPMPASEAPPHGL